MSGEIVHLQPDNFLCEYGLRTQRLQPWPVLNAPFESSWALAEPRTRSTLHAHHEHEIFIAVRGTAVVECGGETAPFRAGDIAFLPPGQQHRLLNDGDDEFVFYSIWWDESMVQKFTARHREELMAGNREELPE
jgi:mannose-6-phosphate isomerase-like protein (cupin superfamily)